MQKFALDHIKSFEQSEEIEIKPITVFVGKNSCGKSSLLRFPAVLAQTFREDALTPLLLFGNLIDYGNYNDVVYRHEAGPIGFKMTFGPEIMAFIRRRYNIYRMNRKFVKIRNIEIQVCIDKPGKKLQVRKIRLYAEGENLCTLNREKNQYSFTMHQLFTGEIWEKCETEITVPDMDFYKFIPLIDDEKLLGRYLEDKNLFKENVEDIPVHIFRVMEYIENNIREEKQQGVSSIFQTLSIISVYFCGIRDCLKRDAERTAYIGPFRENPKRTYRDSESNFNDVGVNGENTSMILRQAAQGDRKLLESVSGWLKEGMGYSLDIQDVGNGLYSLVVCGNEESDNIIDVGYGISQVLPIVTQLFSKIEYRQGIYKANSSEGKTVIFEQPEIHLHPAAQAQLADLFVDCVSSKDRAVNRILIETHSEHLIRKLQVLVADPDVPFGDDQVAVYYVDKDEKGDSYVKKMELDGNGQFEKAWPKGFFDKSYELTKMLMKANSKVRHQEK